MKDHSWIGKVSNLLLTAASLFFLMYVQPKVFGLMVLVLFLFYLSKVLAAR